MNTRAQLTDTSVDWALGASVRCHTWCCVCPVLDVGRIVGTDACTGLKYRVPTGIQEDKSDHSCGY